MNKAVLVSLMLMGNVFYSIIAVPFALKELTENEDQNAGSEEAGALKRGIGYAQALGHTSGKDLYDKDQYVKDRNKAYDKYFGDERQTVKYDDSKRAPFSFGTGMGHRDKSSGGDSYISDWWKTYNNLYSGGSRRRGFGFGTGLGHNTNSGKSGQSYHDALHAKFKELYGKRENRHSPDDDENDEVEINEEVNT